MNRFKQRIYRRAVREAYKTQSTAASKAASADIPTIYQEKEAEEERHEEAKKKIKVVEKGAAKKRKEEAADTRTLEALGTRLRYDVEPFGLLELRKLQGATDAQIERDAEERARQQQREAEKLAKEAKVAESGTLLEGWACESCMHWNADATVKQCGGCFAPAHLVGGSNVTAKKDATGVERPTTPGGTIITKAQGSVLQTKGVNMTEEEVEAQRKAFEEREAAEAERREMGAGRGNTPEKTKRAGVTLADAETLAKEAAARLEKVDPQKNAKRKAALEEAALARAKWKDKAVLAQTPKKPEWRAPDTSRTARLGRWIHHIWAATPWVVRMRKRVPWTIPQLPGTAVFGSVRKSNYYEKKIQDLKGGGAKKPLKDVGETATGPRRPYVSDSESDDDEEKGLSEMGPGSDESDDDDWWYRHMMKHGTDGIMRRK